MKNVKSLIYIPAKVVMGKVSMVVWETEVSTTPNGYSDHLHAPHACHSVYVRCESALNQCQKNKFH